MAFEEPTILCKLDRTYNDKVEALQLEQGEYNGSPTFTLRQVWQTDDEQWRWARAREDKNGKCWASMSLKARELRELGEALIAASKTVSGGKSQSRTGGGPTGQQRRQPPPREQRELDKLDELPTFEPADDDDIPF